MCRIRVGIPSIFQESRLLNKGGLSEAKKDYGERHPSQIHDEAQPSPVRPCKELMLTEWFACVCVSLSP